MKPLISILTLAAVAFSVMATPTETSTGLVMSGGAFPGFEANHGQMHREVKYRARTRGYTTFITGSGATVGFRSGEQFHYFSMEFIGANKSELSPHRELPIKSHYFRGKEQANWQRRVRTFEALYQPGVYQGIDLRYHDSDRWLEYDLIVSPAGKVADIRLRFDGVQRKTLDGEGNLLLSVGDHTIIHRVPDIYQLIDGEKVGVQGEYRLHDDGDVRFEVADYRGDQDLIIDPVLDYATFLGGDAPDSGLAIDVDQEGFVYVIGSTQSLNFPIVNGLQPALDNTEDTFIVKLSPDGQELIFATFLGGA